MFCGVTLATNLDKVHSSPQNCQERCLQRSPLLLRPRFQSIERFLEEEEKEEEEEEEEEEEQSGNSYYNSNNDTHSVG